MNLVIAKNVKMRRDLRGWSQEHLAEASQQSTRTIQRIEAGEPCRADSLVAVAGAFDVDLEELKRDPDAEAAKREMEKWTRIAVSRVSSTADFALLFAAETSSFDCSIRDETIRESAARLHSFIADVMTLGSREPSEHHTFATEMLAIVRELDALNAAVFVGTGKLKVAMPTGEPVLWTIVHFVVVPSDDDLKFVVVPREQKLSL